jgi:phytanoyl-CoA hydroxylase
LATLSQDQLHQFERDGYVVAKGLLDFDEDLQPVVDEYAELLEEMADDFFADGEITSTYADLPFGERLTKIYVEAGRQTAQYLDISLPQKAIEAGTPFWAGSAVFWLLRNKKLLDTVESFIGPEIYSNPVQHVRIKPPEKMVDDMPANDLVKATRWHQDAGVVRPEADDTEMLTVWLPLTTSREEHGCIKLVPGSHRDHLLNHCPQSVGGYEIPTRFFAEDETIPIPMDAGDVLFMSRYTCHGSLANTSDQIRWSFDLRYSPIGQPTGRSEFPGFVARSRSNPESELHDPAVWHDMWHAARDRLAVMDDPTFNRWTESNPACA